MGFFEEKKRKRFIFYIICKIIYIKNDALGLFSPAVYNIITVYILRIYIFCNIFVWFQNTYFFNFNFSSSRRLDSRLLLFYIYKIIFYIHIIRLSRGNRMRTWLQKIGDIRNFSYKYYLHIHTNTLYANSVNFDKSRVVGIIFRRERAFYTYNYSITQYSIQIYYNSKS